MAQAAFERDRVIDAGPETDVFLEDVRRAMAQPQKSLPSKYFYDELGSQLFDEITRLPEYYLTRTEVGIMEQHIGEMVARIGPRCLLIEYGSGSSVKTRILLDHLDRPAGYVPIDISRAHLLQTAEALREAYPGLRVLPVVADYTADFVLPEVAGGRPVVYFPGSTVGNFSPEEAVGFLQHVAEVVGPGGGLLIGVDLRKDPAIIEAAYNDAQGVTAAFNKNMLRHVNRVLGATFDLDGFAHRAFFNEKHGRIEMHLESLAEQCVRLGPLQIPFRPGETILTEYSYKYRLEDFAALAHRAGFEVEQVWTDADDYFSVQYLVVRGG